MSTKNTQPNNKQNSNAPVALELGRKAGAAWKEGNKQNAKGDAFAIACLVDGWNSVEFTFLVPINKEQNETRVTTIGNCVTELKNNDGTKDNKATAARFDALMATIFGISDATNAMAQALRRALQTARYLRAKGMETVELDGKSQLKVPYGLVAPAPKADAPAREKLQYESMKDGVLSLDGKQEMSLRNLNARAVEMFPVKARKAKSKTEAPSEEQSFAAAVVYATKTLDKLIAVNTAEGAEADVALSNERRRELVTLAEKIAAYFAADPIGDEEVKPDAAAA